MSQATPDRDGVSGTGKAERPAESLALKTDLGRDTPPSLVRAHTGPKNA